MAVQFVLADVVSEGAVAEDDGCFARRRQLGVPRRHSVGEGFDVVPGNLVVEASDQRTGADGTDQLARDGARLDGHAEIKPELQQQLVEDVLLTAVGLDVFDVGQQRPFQVVTVRFPGADVGGVELEDAKAEVAREHGILVLDLLCGAAEAFFGKFSDVAGFAELIAKISGDFLVLGVGIERFRELHKDIAVVPLGNCVLLHYGMCGSSRSSEEIED